jgi:hypothetical protein
MAKRSHKLSPSQAGFVFGLLSLPFVAGGIIAASMSWRTMSESDAVRSWVEVPATIERAELDVEVRRDRSYHGRDLRTRTRTTYHLNAAYEYEFEGQRYTGNRVSVHGNDHNSSAGITFLVNAQRELERHRALGKPFRCFVNPRRPIESLLYRDPPWQVAAGYTLFATLFGAIGFGILSGVLATTWRRWRQRAAGAALDGRPSSVALLVLAVLVAWWTIASYPLVVRLPEVLSSATSPFSVVTLIFPAVGVVLLLAFVYQAARRLRSTFGDV